MVDIREERVEVTRATGHVRGKLRQTSVVFNQELFDQIKAEALSRGWTFGHMVRHLCEASIEGIE